MPTVSGIQFGVRVEARDALVRLGRMTPRVRKEVMNALDEVAALAQAHARRGHPKVHDRFQGDDARGFREASDQSSGPFAGHLRFLKRTGVLVNSIKIAKAKKTDHGLESGIFSAVRYADRIEFGSVRNPPYPFMRPAAYAVLRPMEKLLAAAAKRGLGG